MSILRRFAYYLNRDDRQKDAFLLAIENGAGQEVALERASATAGEAVTVATVRRWMSDDPDFAQALRVARNLPPYKVNVWGADENPDPNAPPSPTASETEIAAAGWRGDVFGPQYGPGAGWR